MQLTDKNILVYGAAKSGISAAHLLQKLGANVWLFDCNTKLTKEDFKDKLEVNRQFTFLSGTLKEVLLPMLDLIIISPGVALDHPDVLQLTKKNIPVWSEIELAYCFTKGKIIGITGTNGKTTTTTLVGEVMKAYFSEVFVVGNIGECYSDHALNTSAESVTVIELSSFQLETIHTFKPDISIILNISPDHLDRHHTMDHYIAAKERIAMNQTETELCILNYEDEILRTLSSRLNTDIMFFSSARKLTEGIYLDGDTIYYSNKLKTEFVCNVNELQLLGKHNYENVMAAVGAAITIGIPLEYIRKTILDFRAVEHRIEYVETIDGVTYYNDSKGTNPDAAIRALQAIKGPTLLIAGGYDKKVSFDDLINSFEGKVKYLILLGQTREQLAVTAKKHGFTRIIMVNSLREAVNVSAKKAEAGDAVLLSPACASWDMFDNYEQRGKLFKEYVREML